MKKKIVTHQNFICFYFAKNPFMHFHSKFIFFPFFFKLSFRAICREVNMLLILSSWSFFHLFWGDSQISTGPLPDDLSVKELEQDRRTLENQIVKFSNHPKSWSLWTAAFRCESVARPRVCKVKISGMNKTEYAFACDISMFFSRKATVNLVAANYFQFTSVTGRYDLAEPQKFGGKACPFFR